MTPFDREENIKGLKAGRNKTFYFKQQLGWQQSATGPDIYLIKISNPLQQHLLIGTKCYSSFMEEMFK